MESRARKTFGKNLNRLRTAANLTQERFAEKAEMSRRFLQEVESGAKSPTLPVLARIRIALNCTWDEILKGI